MIKHPIRHHITLKFIGNNMEQYHDLLKNIMTNGVDRSDRTGVGTRSLFAQQMRFDLNDGFPILTTKKVPFKSVVSELLWFLEGSSDERRLAEILYGKPREQLTDKKTIWTANAQADYWKPKAEFDGDLGRIYSKQWRDFNGIDQIKNVIENIKTKPWDRRHVVDSWNAAELDQMALPPCHMSFQFYVANNKLNCHMYQRSADYFLGVPFNISSYAVLTHMIAQVCELDVGELVLTLGDAHVYFDHFDAVDELLKRESRALPELWLNPNINDIDDFTMDDIKLVGYIPHDTIKAKMAV